MYVCTYVCMYDVYMLQDVVSAYVPSLAPISLRAPPIQKCMYVCVCVCMYVYMYVYMYVCVCICMSVSSTEVASDTKSLTLDNSDEGTYTHLFTYIHAYISILIHKYTYSGQQKQHERKNFCMDAWPNEFDKVTYRICRFVYTHICIRTYIHTYIHITMHAYIPTFV